VFFGGLMTAAIVLLVLGEGWLASREYFGWSGRMRGVGFGALMAVFVVAGCRELGGIARAKGLNPSVWLMGTGAVMIVMQPFWAPGKSGILAAGAVLMGAVMAGSVAQAKRQGTEKTLANLGALCFGMVYLGFGGWFIVALRLLGEQAAGVWGQTRVVLLFLACVKCSDIGAYFTGRYLGRHKLVPSISPGKTWEGFVGGVAVAVIVASIFAVFFDIISYWEIILFGILMAISGQLGDLLESMLKRDAGSKDSAKLVPEFGGILDIIDSPIVAAPIGYFLLNLYGIL